MDSSSSSSAAESSTTAGATTSPLLLGALISIDSKVSGHSSRVFFVASLVHLSASVFVDALTAEGKVVNLLIAFVWVWAAATSASRVLLGRHFVVDVFAGALLGILEGIFAFNFLKIEKFV
uniref:Phosphatidic acid phosphatase type 2/haloperoxidase domain-containing protein n=1 Tax=Cannabis sativa TaxID=3483 RepID=A0A803PM30_CANSA